MPDRKAGRSTQAQSHGLPEERQAAAGSSISTCSSNERRPTSSRSWRPRAPTRSERAAQRSGRQGRVRGGPVPPAATTRRACVRVRRRRVGRGRV